MATIINNPTGTTEDSSAGIIIGVVVALLLVVLFILFVWPSISGRATPTDNTTPSANLNVTLPGGTTNTSPAATQ